MVLETKAVLALLEEERVELSAVDSLPEEILDAPSDDFPDLVAKRGDRLTNAVRAEKQIKELAASDGTLAAVLEGRAELAKLTPEQRQMFEASLRVKAILCRIRRFEPQVVARLENERAEALDHIAELNQSSATVAGSYKAALRTAVPDRALNSMGMSI